MFFCVHIHIISENCPVNKTVTALSIIADKRNTSSTKSIRPTILCGLGISCQDKPHVNPSTQNEETLNTTKLYLVVYDFLFTKEQDDVENDVTLNTSRPCNHEENMNMYSSNLYDGLEPSEFETEDVSGYTLMKQLSSYYKTFIPGESDEIFLPPPMTTKPSHTGPKVLHDAYDSKKTVFSENNYQFTSIHTSSENTDVTISDHITEVSRIWSII